VASILKELGFSLSSHQGGKTGIYRDGEIRVFMWSIQPGRVSLPGGARLSGWVVRRVKVSPEKKHDRRRRVLGRRRSPE
jgi:hypothetical protein